MDFDDLLDRLFELRESLSRWTLVIGLYVYGPLFFAIGMANQPTDDPILALKRLAVWMGLGVVAANLSWHYLNWQSRRD